MTDKHGNQIIWASVTFTSRIENFPDREITVPIADSDSEFLAMIRDRWQRWYDAEMAELRQNDKGSGGATLG